MKKRTLLLMTGCMLAFASCSNSDNGQVEVQRKIDSMVNVKVSALQAHTEEKNDSIINALAKAKADSILAAAKNVPVHTDTNRSRDFGRNGDTQTVTRKPVPPAHSK